MTQITQTRPPLSPAEERVQTAFKLGEVIEFSRALSHNQSEDGPNPHNSVRASVLRDILLSPESPGPGHIPKVHVINAHILGDLDLQFAKIDFPIRLECCRFDGHVTISEAELRSLSLRGSIGLTIDAAHIKVTGDLQLDGIHLNGPLKLGGAHLDDDLHLRAARIDQSTVPGQAPVSDHVTPPAPATRRDAKANIDEAALVDFENLDVRGTVQANDLKIQGTFSTKGATVGGSMYMQGAQLGEVEGAPESATVPVAWDSDGLNVGGVLNIERLRARGGARLIDAKMQTLVMDGMKIVSPTWALLVDRLQCSGSVFCRDVDLTGPVGASRIEVGASCCLTGSVQVAASSAWALAMQRAQISDNLECKGLRTNGTIDITNARVGGSVLFDGASLWLAEHGSISLTASRAQIGGNLTFQQDFHFNEAMSLNNAQVDGDLKVDDGTARRDRTAPKRNDRKKPLYARGLRVGGNAGISISGRVGFADAKVAGIFTIDLARLVSGGGEPAADLSNVGANVLCVRGRPRKGYVDLTRASVQLLRDEPANWNLEDRHTPSTLRRRGRIPRDQRVRARQTRRTRIVLDGFQYEGKEGVRTTNELGDRLGWLEAGSQWIRRTGGMSQREAGAPHFEWVGFTPQPYQQLAAVYRREGRDDYARDVLYAMYCRQSAVMRERSSMRKSSSPLRVWPVRAWNRAQDVTVGYGYRPLRAFGWLILLASLASAWWIWFDKKHLGIIQAGILSFGFALPGSGLDKVESWKEVSAGGHLFAVALVLSGLVLGATVISAIGRAFKR